MSIIPYALCSPLALPDGASAPEWIHVLPLGTFKGHPAGPLVINRQTLGQIVANFRARLPSLLLVDDEHASETAFLRGEAVDATAWIDDLQERDDGLWAHVERYVGDTADRIRTKKVRYVSPVVEFHHRDPNTGADQGYALRSVALTNLPWFGGKLEPLLASVAAAVHPQAQHGRRTAGTLAGSFGAPVPLLARLIALLGLPETASEDDVCTAVEGMKTPAADMTTKAAAADAACSVLSCEVGQLEAKAREVIVDSQKAIINLQRELAQAKAGHEAETDDALLASAIAGGRVLPAQKADLQKLLKADPVAGRAFIASLQPLGLFERQPGGTRTSQPTVVSNPEAAGVSAAEAAAAAAKRSR